ncbi:HAD domain-containing protein [Streptomyces sp. NPDC058662]|uniref:HAD domain-containing protein n=1 Tax=Streptomyces sp. NPDC058662 TaxID=3346583 RepID=UPI0036674487
MTGHDVRPLLFLDVDGPLIPFGAGPYPRGTDPNPLLARLDPALGPLLADSGFDLVWATTWMADANEVIAPRLGLPELPLVHWPEQPEADGWGGRGGVHWKTPALCAHAAGRDFVWLDDEITDADRVWTAAHHRGRALLHRVDPGVGLTGADFAALSAWL